FRRRRPNGHLRCRGKTSAEFFQRGSAEGTGRDSVCGGVLDWTSAAAFESGRDAPFCLESALCRSAGHAPTVSLQLPDCCHCRFHAAAAAGTAGAAGEVRGAAENGGPSFSPASRSQDRSARGGSAQRIAELFGAATENL